MMRKLSKEQRELLRVLAIGPRDCITDKRIVRALGVKGLATHDGRTDTWTITDAGRAILAAEARGA